LDQYEPTPPEGWLCWTDKQIQNADFVLMICTENYFKRLMGEEKPEVVWGVRWKGHLIYHQLYQNGTVNTKFISALFHDGSEQYIPIPLQGFVHYRIDTPEGYEDLYRHLTGQPCHQKSELGQLKKLPPIQRRTDFFAGACPDPLAISCNDLRWNLPLIPNKNFVGREDELRQLHQIFSSQPDTLAISQPPQSIWGLGGIGKTQLALEYVHRHPAEYQGIFWVDAAGNDITSAIAKLARELQLPLPEGISIEEQARQVRKVLENGNRYLLILDNIDHPHSYLAHLPRMGQTRVLITTRLQNLEQVKPLYLDVLPLDEALKLLLGDRSFSFTEQKAARQLCEVFGRLTIAVAISARIIARGVRKPSDLLKEVQGKGLVDCSEQNQPDLFQPESSMKSIFQTSLNILNEKSNDIGTLTQNLALVGGWFAPVSIPQDLLYKAADRLQPVTLPEIKQKIALQQLVDSGLARCNEKGYLVFHPLTQAYLRHQGGQPAKTACCYTLAAIAQKTDTGIKTLLSLEIYRPHFEQAVTWLTKNLPDEFLWIPLRLLQYLVAIAEYANAFQLVNSIFALIDEENKEWLTHFYDIAGEICELQGKYEESFKYYRGALDLKEQRLGETHPDIAITLNAIGQTLYSQGKYDEALDYYRRALVIKEQTLGVKHPEITITLYAIGQTLYRQENYEEALNYYRRDLSITEQTFGADHPEVAITLNAIGQTLDSQGKCWEALEYYRRALVITAQKLGTNHPSTASIINALGQTLHHLGEYEEALECYHRALAIQEEALGAAHPETAITLHAIGQTLDSQGKYEEALAYFRRDLTIKEQYLGTDHPDIAATLHDIGLVLYSQGKYEEALEKLKQSLQIIESTFGPEHPSFALVNENISYMLQNQKEKR
jgi:tetratricopeptide (TPR) repeat protein